MATIVVLGAGIGGVSQAFELKPLPSKNDRLIVVSDQARFEFTPSNPWVAVGWRSEEQITVELPALFKKHGIEFVSMAASRLQPEDNKILLADGETVQYDYLVIATGPKLAFDEIEGLGPDGYTSSICKTGHALESRRDFEALVKEPATAQNIRNAMAGAPLAHRATWNAVCLADFGDTGVAFVASPQIPPRNTNWASKGKWVHVAKVGFEKYFLRKVRQGKNEPYYEKLIMKWIGAERLKDTG